MMKINTVETIIDDFRSGQNIFRRPSVELLVREVSRLQSRVAELEAENKMVFEQLQDPVSVRICILSGRIRIPDDLVFFYDTHGKVADLRNRIAELEAELMFYQMECPDLVGRYQPQKDGE